jgi:hypothetical protein
MSRRTSTRWYFLAAALVGAGMIGTSLAEAMTIASFADPTVGTSPLRYMFAVRDGSPGTITQPSNAPGVNLYLDESTGAGGLHSGVSLTYTQLTYTGGFLAGGSIGQGYFDFLEQGQSLLRIDFDSAYLSRSSVGADDIFSASNVHFSVNGQPLPIEGGTGSFAFSFTNQKPYPGAPAPTTGFDATAAFNCSANVLPEPATVLVLGMGTCLALLRRRR